MSLPYVTTGPSRESRYRTSPGAFAIGSGRETSSQNHASASGVRSTVTASSIVMSPSALSDSSNDYVPCNSPTLALIDLVDVVTLSDIRHESKFRPIRQAIFDIADSQINMYNRLENGEDEWESDDEDSIGSDDEDGQSDVSSYDADSDPEYAGDEDIARPPNSPKDSRALKGYLFQLAEFNLLSQKLTVRGNFLLKFELYDGYLLIRTVPGLLHETSVDYFRDELQHWAMVPNATGLNKYTLQGSGGTSMLLVIILLHYRLHLSYRASSTYKEPRRVVHPHQHSDPSSKGSACNCETRVYRRCLPYYHIGDCASS